MSSSTSDASAAAVEANDQSPEEGEAQCWETRHSIFHVLEDAVRSRRRDCKKDSPYDRDGGGKWRAEEYYDCDFHKESYQLSATFIANPRDVNIFSFEFDGERRWTME